MASPAIDLKDLACADSSFTFADNVFVGGLPEEVEPAIAFTDSGGFAPEGINDLEYPTVQVLIRGEPFKYAETFNLIKGVGVILHKVNGDTVSGSFYTGIWQQGEPLFLGFDEKNRPSFSLNFRIQRS